MKNTHTPRTTGLDMTWDIRTIARRSESQNITEKDYKAYVKALPDTKSKAVSLLDANKTSVKKSSAD